MVSITGPRAQKHLNQINHRLTAWYLKLPPALRFKPWADNPTAPSPATVAAPNIIILLTTYNAIVTLLHRPFIGTRQPASDSWERCLTAARNITSLALVYRSAYSLRRANYLLSYALYMACTIYARNPVIRESTRCKEASSPLTVCLWCLDELAVPNCGVSTLARIILRLMEANGMDAEGDDVNFQEPFPVDMNLDFQMLPGLDFGVEHDSENLMLHDFNPDVDLLFGFMSGSYLDMNGVV